MLIEMMNTIDASPCSRGRLLEVGDARLGEPERAPHVDLEDLAPLREVDLVERLERVHAERVVDEHVEPAELVDGAGDERRDLLGSTRLVGTASARPPSASISSCTSAR